MLTLIHGEDTTASRNYFFEIKKDISNAKLLDGATISPIDLQQAVEGSDLFGTVPTVFIDQLISKRKSQKDVEELIQILNSSSANIFIWEQKALTKKQLEQFNNITIKEFKIPAIIFALLDSLQPGNGKRLIEQFHMTLQDKDAEFVLVMLQRQIRILLSMQSANGPQTTAVDRSQNAISEIGRMAPWQQGKLNKQAKLFTIEQLITLHQQLFQLELGMKTGSLSSSLENELDILFLQL